MTACQAALLRLKGCSTVPTFVSTNGNCENSDIISLELLLLCVSLLAFATSWRINWINGDSSEAYRQFTAQQGWQEAQR